MTAKIRRVGRLGPRCSTKPKDRYFEMLAPDYEPVMVPRFVLDAWRKQELAWLRGGTR